MSEVSIHVRVCPDCGEEYRPEIVRCADCGAQLEDRHLSGASEDPVPGVVHAPVAPLLAPGGDLRKIASRDQAADMEPLAKQLGGAAIPFAVRGSYQSFELLVGAGDVERALAALAPLLGDDSRAAPDGNFDPASGYQRCPACESGLAPGALECPACGLAMGEPGKACPSCGSPLGPLDVACGSCGSRSTGEG